MAPLVRPDKARELYQHLYRPLTLFLLLSAGLTIPLDSAAEGYLRPDAGWWAVSTLLTQVIADVALTLDLVKGYNSARLLSHKCTKDMLLP